MAESTSPTPAPAKPSAKTVEQLRKEYDDIAAKVTALTGDPAAQAKLRPAKVEAFQAWYHADAKANGRE